MDVDERFRVWLRTMTGCGFAAFMARRAGGVGINVFAGPEPAESFDETLDQAAERDLAVVFVLPWIEAESGIVDLLFELSRSSSRWSVVRRKKAGGRDAVHIGVEWKTASGLISNVMGFAPLLTMPATRRSPYVAIATWPGGRRNPRWTPKPGSQRVSFVDAAHGVEDGKYDDKWKRTELEVAGHLGPGDSAARYRNVAFVVSMTFESRFAAT